MVEKERETERESISSQMLLFYNVIFFISDGKFGERFLEMLIGGLQQTTEGSYLNASVCGK